MAPHNVLNEMAARFHSPAALRVLAQRGGCDDGLLDNGALTADAALIILNRGAAKHAKKMVDHPVARHGSVRQALLECKASSVRAAVLAASDDPGPVADRVLANGKVSTQVVAAALHAWPSLTTDQRRRFAEAGDHRAVFAYAYSDSPDVSVVRELVASRPARKDASPWVAHIVAAYPSLTSALVTYSEYASAVAGTPQFAADPHVASTLVDEWMGDVIANRYRLLAAAANPMVSPEVTNAIASDRFLSADSWWYNHRDVAGFVHCADVSAVPEDVAARLASRMVNVFSPTKRPRLASAPALAANENWSDVSIGRFLDAVSERVGDDDLSWAPNAVALDRALELLVARGFAQAGQIRALLGAGARYSLSRRYVSRVLTEPQCAGNCSGRVGLVVSSSYFDWMSHEHVLADAFADDAQAWSLALDMLDSFDGTLPDLANMVTDVLASAH